MRSKDFRGYGVLPYLPSTDDSLQINPRGFGKRHEDTMVPAKVNWSLNEFGP